MVDRRISYNNNESIVGFNSININNEEVRSSDTDKLTTTPDADKGVLKNSFIFYIFLF